MCALPSRAWPPLGEGVCLGPCGPAAGGLACEGGTAPGPPGPAASLATLLVGPGLPGQVKEDRARGCCGAAVPAPAPSTLPRLPRRLGDRWWLPTGSGRGRTEVWVREPDPVDEPEWSVPLDPQETFCRVPGSPRGSRGRGQPWPGPRTPGCLRVPSGRPAALRPPLSSQQRVPSVGVQRGLRAPPLDSGRFGTCFQIGQFCRERHLSR